MEQRRLLIVEGDLETGRDLARRLESLGYSVAGVATSGQEALDQARLLLPDAFLVDSHLPGDLDGVGTALALRSIHEAPILFLKPLDEAEPSAQEDLASPAASLLVPFCDREIRAVLRMVFSESRGFYRNLIEHNATMIFVKDREGHYRLVNRKWEGDLGLSREATLGRTDADLFPEEDARRLRQDDLQVMEQGSLLELEEAVSSPAGLRHFLTLKFPHRDGTGRIIGVCGMSTEITARKQAEMKLRKALDEAVLYRSILDDAPAYVYIKDREGRYLYANRVTLEFLGQTALEIPGKGDADFFPPRMARHLRRLDRRALGGERLVNELTLRSGSGEERVFWEVKMPLHAEGSGEPAWGVVGIATDITERKRSEDERVRFQEQLQQVVKMESIGRLAGGVAHDFNNMLSVILGQAELALERVGQGHAPNPELEEIRAAAQRSAGLTRQLLAFARKQTVLPKVLDLNQAVERMLGVLRRLMGGNLELVWSPGPDLWAV